MQALQQSPRSQPVSSPLGDSKSLLLIGKGVKISSSETSSCWAGAKDPSLFSRCRSKSLVACPKDRRDLGQSPLGWAEFLEPS